MHKSKLPITKGRSRLILRLVTGLFCVLLLSQLSFAQSTAVELVKTEPLGTVYPLWGKQSPKFVVTSEGHQYAVLHTAVGQPFQIDLYRNLGSGWQFWMRMGPSHQTASLALDRKGLLHVIYPAASTGEVVHWTVDITSGARQIIYTGLWQGGNYYQGIIYDEVLDRIYLCSNQWPSSKFRCGMFADRWWGPWLVEELSNLSRFLYPSLVSNDHRIYVQAGRLTNGGNNSSYDSVRLFELDLYGQRFLREYNMAIPSGIFNPFVGGLRDISSGQIFGQIIYTSPAGLTNTTLVSINNGKMEFIGSTPAYDDAPDLGVHNDVLYTAAWGEIHASEDLGKTWNTVADIVPPTGGNYVYAHFPRQNYSDKNIMMFSFSDSTNQGIYTVELLP